MKTHHVGVRSRGRRRTHAARTEPSTTIRPVLPPAALDRAAVDHLTLELDDGHRGVLMRIKLDESEATVRLHADLREVANRLEEGDEIGLSRVRDEVADVDGGVIRGSLGYHGLVRERPTLEVHRRWGPSAHASAHGGGAAASCALSLLVGPVDADRARAKPLAIHSGDGLFSIGLVAEGKETVATRLAGVHVPHDARIREGAERTERLGEDVVVDLGAEVADEDVVVVARVLLILLALVGPVDADFGVENLAPVEGLEGSLGCAHIHVLNETIVETAVLIVAVWDDLDVLHRTGHSEDLGQHIFRHPRAEVSDIEVSPSLAVVIDGEIDKEDLELWHDDIE